MSDTPNNRARELLAAEYEADGFSDKARDTRSGEPLWYYDAAALRAIEKAMSDTDVGLKEALVNTAAGLAAAVSLLKRGGKKAAASDKMFDQMIVDYERRIDRARAALAALASTEGPTIP